MQTPFVVIKTADLGSGNTQSATNIRRNEPRLSVLLDHPDLETVE